MTRPEIVAYVMALPPADLDRQVAEKVMGWRLSEKTGGYRFWRYKNGKCVPGGSLSEQGWHPSTDRNQSRMVTDKVSSTCSHILYDLYWWAITALDETRAALIAHMIHEEETKEGQESVVQ